jgi:hypothetical protein
MRAAIAKEHGNDLKALARALRRKGGTDGRRGVDFSAKRTAAKRTRKAGLATLEEGRAYSDRARAA